MLIPPDQPNFTCAFCDRAMCADCLSLAAEYEYLASTRQLELMTIQAKLNEMEAKLSAAEHMQKVWKDLAQMGQADVIQMFLESVVWQRVCKPPKNQLNRELTRLERRIRTTLELPGGDR